MRFAMGLTIVGAALLITGLLMVFVSEALRLKYGHSGPGILRAGELVAFSGLGIGVALLVVLTIGRGDRGRAGRGGHGRHGGVGGAGTGDRRDPAEDWLSPLRTAGAGPVRQRAMPSWPEPVEEDRPGSGDYADDGWDPDMGDADDSWHPRMDDRWNPRPAHVGSPRQEDDWDRGGYVSRLEPRYLAGPEAGYLTVGPAHGHAAAPRFAGEAGKAYPEAPSPDAPEFDGTQEDDDTSPIPVIRGPGQPVPEPREREPVAAPEPFSVWEPAPKPSQERRRDSPSNDGYRPAHAEPPSANAQEKIEQIKDLYLTAEAIGEDALGRHFDQLRERQRSLIREFFEKVGLESKGTPTPLGDDSAQDGASLPG
jgi:hypothetical protein